MSKHITRGGDASGTGDAFQLYPIRRSRRLGEKEVPPQAARFDEIVVYPYFNQRAYIASFFFSLQSQTQLFTRY